MNVREVAIGLILIPLALTAMAEEYSVLVKRSHVDESKYEELISKLMKRSGRSREDAEWYYRESSASNLVGIGETEIRTAFPVLAPTDERYSMCSNSIMSGKTQIVYLSDADKQEVTVKSTNCEVTEEGLLCTEMSVRRLPYYQEPEKFYEIGNGLSTQEVAQLLRNLDDKGLSDFNSEKEWLSNIHVRSAVLSDSGVILKFGEFYCAGCEYEFTVERQQEGVTKELKVNGQVRGVCY